MMKEDGGRLPVLMPDRLSQRRSCRCAGWFGTGWRGVAWYLIADALVQQHQPGVGRRGACVPLHPLKVNLVAFEFVLDEHLRVNRDEELNSACLSP